MVGNDNRLKESLIFQSGDNNNRFTLRDGLLVMSGGVPNDFDPVKNFDYIIKKK